ncbi:ParB/RepB/Spo0J family partition protein [Geodermatophilus sp. SYSU D00700]
MKNNKVISRHHDGTGGRRASSTALRGRPSDARPMSRGAVREATCGPQDRVRAHISQDDAVTMTQDPPGDRMTAIAGVHPYAEKFPMLPEDELAELAESVRANGLRQPIVVTPDGLILDGRNRWAACQRAGVPPVTVVYQGEDAAQFVIDCNVTRRHMSTGAPAMATALVLHAAGRRANGRWKRGSVPADNRDSSVSSGWEQAMRQAGAVLDEAPDLAPKVVSGEMTLNAAYEWIKRADVDGLPTDEDAARAYVQKHAPDLAELVADGTYRSYREVVWWAHYLDADRQRQERADREAQRRMERGYTNLAASVHRLAGLDGALIGGVDRIMGDYDPAKLDATSGVSPRDLEPDSLRRAAHFLTQLAEWAERRTKP